MDDSKILSIITENLKTSGKHIIIRDNKGNIIYPKDLDSIKDVERLLKLKSNGRELYDEKNGNYYIKKTNIFYDDDNEYRFDLIENNNKLKKIEEKAKFDSATNLLNKETIMTVLDQILLNQAHDISSLAIVVCDIDKFKTINDTYGHLAGDVVLETISKKLKEHLNNCSIGRFGGDEFVLIFKNVASATIYEQIENLRQIINKLSIKTNNKEINDITMSFGIYAINDFKDIEYQNLNSIVEERRRMFYNADEALYQSKENGRNKITLFEANDNDKTYIVSDDNLIDYNTIEELFHKKAI